jgi:hypothetical protein
VLAVVGRGLAHNFAEHPVEMSERLEADFEGNLADAQTGICQEFARAFHPQARDVLREVQSSVFLKELADVKCARAGGLCDIGQMKFFL